jgi:hypothetical protein
MADRPLDLRVLRQVLRRYGVWEDTSKGKGSHTTFLRRISGSVFSYPIPTHRDPVKLPYIRGCRKRFRLTAQDGISDEEFYS